MGWTVAAGGWDSDGSRRLLEKAAAVDPLNPVSEGARGWLQWIPGDFEAALESFAAWSRHWWNAGDQTLFFEGFAKPLVDLDRYLQAVLEIINPGPEGRPPLFYLAHAARRHRTAQTAFVAPRPVLAVLFPVLVGLGTLLGKYRGTEWPGCPARCTGAPIVAAEDA